MAGMGDPWQCDVFWLRMLMVKIFGKRSAVPPGPAYGADLALAAEEVLHSVP